MQQRNLKNIDQIRGCRGLRKSSGLQKLHGADQSGLRQSRITLGQLWDFSEWPQYVHIHDCIVETGVLSIPIC